VSIVLYWQKSQKTEPVKAAPRSVMILLGTPKVMLDVSDEFDYLFGRYFRNRSDFNPLGKLIDGHQYMFVDTWAVRNGPIASRPHIAKGHNGGMVRRTWAGRCCCLAKNWHPLQLFTRSLASVTAVSQ
jgi:hypothetical protein